MDGHLDMSRRAQIALRVARELREAANGSAFVQAARAYAHRAILADESSALDDGGFVASAAALFEAMMEMAFLTVAAEGQLGDHARAVFRSVLDEVVPDEQVEALLADLEEQLAEDGLEKRVRMVCRTITSADHQREGLFLAAFVAHLFGPPSAQRHQVLERLALGFRLDGNAVDEVIRKAEQSLALD